MPMIEVDGIWLPDGETHLQVYFVQETNKPATYQYKKYDAALKYMKQRRRALDIGGHVGLWSMHMVNDFDVVEVFEPTARHRECFPFNVSSDNYNMYPVACGDKIGRASMLTPREGQTGNTVIIDGDDVDIVVLDDYSFKDVDFIKIDVEGYELNVVKGAEKTIKENKPVMVIEQKRDNAERYGFKQTEASELLQSWGMIIKQNMGNDHIMSWE